MVRWVVLSIDALQRAGFHVFPAEGVPGLWNVEGLARDVTTNQLHDLADKHGVPVPIIIGPNILTVSST